MTISLVPAQSVNGELRVPGDKSVSHRAAIFGAMAVGTTRIAGFLRADDTCATLAALRVLGAEISDDGTKIVIVGRGLESLRAPDAPLNCGNSGTTMRLLMGLLAGRPFQSVLHGDESLSRRPMDRIAIPLQQMGAQISGDGARVAPPIRIVGGHLNGITYEMPVASAQVKSGVLLAGLQATGTTTVIEPTPARDHTERMLRAFGVEVESLGNCVRVQGGAALRATDVAVPGDISSAAFFFVAAALRPGWKTTVRGVGLNPTRTGILDVLRAMGAKIEIENQSESGGEARGDVTVMGAALLGTQIGGSLIPRLIDELPVLALLATQAQGTTLIRDAAEMRVKESDRIAIIARELTKLGADVREQPDGLMISGPTPLVGASVSSPRGDHRIAMTLAVASLVAKGETTLANAEAVSSSFPNFLELLQSVKH